MMNSESQKISLGVYRCLHNQPEGSRPDSPLALECHNRRKEALHKIFDKSKLWNVHKWGETDDTKSHEYVELIIEVVSNPQVQAVAIPVLAFIGGVISNAAGNLVADGVKSLFTRLRNAQVKKEVQEITITLSNGVRVECVPINGDAKVTVSQPGAQPITVGYNDTQQEIQAKLSR